MRFFLGILCLFAVPAALAQEPADPAAAEDSVEVLGPAWSTDLTSKLSASQAAYRNWTQGGVNTLAFAVQLDGDAVRTSESWEQKHDLRLGFGLVKQDTLEVRKAADEIRLNSSLQYKGNGFFRHFNPTVASGIRTQFAAGFNYKKNPFEDGRPPPVKVSDFFSPAVFTQSIGLTYDPARWFTQRLGFGGKETVVLIDRFRRLYGLDPDQPVEFELGLESRTELDREVFENVRVQSTLALFAAFNKPDMPDLLWENLIAMQVNSWLSVNFEVDTLYDRDISNLLQVKEVLALGISIVII